MDEFIYVNVKNSPEDPRGDGKTETILCFQKTKDKAKKILQKIAPKGLREAVDAESSFLSSDGSEIFNSGKADQNQISLYQTEPGFIGQSLTLKSPFSIYKIADRPKPDIDCVEVLP